MVLIVLPPHYLIRLGVLFLSKWRVYDSLVGFGVNLLFFFSFLLFFFFFTSLSSSGCVLAMQKVILTLQFPFSFDSVTIILIAIVLITFIIYYFILFSVSSMVI
jgi:hypothetical protein